jgi:ABC-2 type transport system permease protein
MSAELALARQLLRSRLLVTLLWAAGFATVLYSSSASYLAAYPSQPQRQALARSLESNLGLAALFGRTRSVDTIGGFAAWRSLGLLIVVGGCWGVLTGARLLRGEEDAGRWELLLAGRITRARAVLAALIAAAGLVLVLFLVTAAGALLGARATGLPVGASLFLALILVLPAALFLLVGLCCGQLTGSRRSAVRLAAVVFGLSYLLRLIAIAADLDWLGRLTPLGWIEASHPMTGTRLLPLLPVGLLCLAVGAATVFAAVRRDLGAGVFGSASRSDHSSGLLLGGAGPLAVRQTLPVLAGWLAALTTMCLVTGLVAGSVGDQAAQSELVRNLVSRMGASRAGILTFVALTMTMISTLIALAAAGLLAAIREDEESGLVQNILVLRVSRTRWLATRIGVVLAVVLLLGGVVGAVLYLALLGAHTGLGLGTLLASGLNSAAPAVVVLGLAVLCLGFVPRWTAAIGYGIVAMSFLIELVGAAVAAPSWLLDLSLLHHIALAPAVAPNWRTNGVLCLIAVLAALLGGWRFRSRDVTG